MESESYSIKGKKGLTNTQKEQKDAPEWTCARVL